MIQAPKGVDLRPIPGVVGYAAGSDGYVYSFHRPRADANGRPKYRLIPRRLSPGRGRSGHVHVGINWRGLKYHSVHRLVCSAFHGPCPAGTECSHLNGDPSDNMPENLRWETRSSNHLRKRAHGTMLKGSAHPVAKLTEVKVNEIRALATTLTQDAIASMYGVSQATVSNILNGKIWRHARETR